MPSSPQPPSESRFARAVEALCLSREDIARALDLTPAVLDAYATERLPVPPIVQLALVDLLKAHEAKLGGAAGSLYDEAMYRLERSGLAHPVVPTATEPPPPGAGGGAGSAA